MGLRNLTGVVAVTPSQLLDDEERWWWEHFGRQPEMVFLRVLRVAKLAQSTPAVFNVARLHPGGQGFPLLPDQVAWLLAQASDQGCPIRAIAASWGDVAAAALQTDSAFTAWTPAAVLIADRMWKSIGFTRRSRLIGPGFNALRALLNMQSQALGGAGGGTGPRVANAEHAPGREPVMDDDEEDSVWMESLHDPRNFQRLAGLLRDWADKLLNGRPVDTEEERVQFECQIGWVEQQADLLNAAAYGQKESFGRRGFQKRYK